MTENEWLTSTDPLVMLRFLRDAGKASGRKLRLFAVACCRRIQDGLLDKRSREAVDVSERYADGQADANELDRARKEAMAAARVLGHPPAHAAASSAIDDDPAFYTCRNAARAAAPQGTSTWDVWTSEEFRSEQAAQAELLRELFGNPFRPVRPLDLPEPADKNVILSLARAAYDERLPNSNLGPARLAVLADALLDAGCEPDHELLAHLRSPRAHVRGCFAIDLILAKGR